MTSRLADLPPFIAYTPPKPAQLGFIAASLGARVRVEYDKRYGRVRTG